MSKEARGISIFISPKKSSRSGPDRVFQKVTQSLMLIVVIVIVHSTSLK